jgi:hypothetical protein
MRWRETHLGRLKTHIFNLFEEYLKKHPIKDYRHYNALLDVRNLVIQSVENFLQEPSIKKKYGVPVESLSLISFSDHEEPVNPQSSWIPIPSDEDETRPAGITNEEFKEFVDRLDKFFNDNRTYGSPAHLKVVSIFHEAFFKPSANKPFKGGTYVRRPYGTAETTFEKSQAVPCEVCGENRVVDVSHIIPRRLKGSERIDNVLFLCPTHHRLFDTCMLSEEEWNKIEWTRKSRKSQIYASKVFKIGHKKFWEKIESGVTRKQTTWEIGLPKLYDRTFEKEAENVKKVKRK